MKESILKTDSRIVFKETFGSEDIVDGILSQQEVAQLYQSEKINYGL